MQYGVDQGGDGAWQGGEFGVAGVQSRHVNLVRGVGVQFECLAAACRAMPAAC